MKDQIIWIKYDSCVDDIAIGIFRYPIEVSRLVVVEYENRHCYPARSA